MKIGIDYSINSPGICIETNGRHYFFTVQKKDSKCCRKLDMLSDVTVYVIEKENMTDFEFQDKQTTLIVDTIEEMMKISKEKELIIGIEDYIYYSQHNSLIDIVQATTLLKYKIIKKWGEGVLNKYSPTAVKKEFSGKGNASKEDMLGAFKKMEIKTPFHQWCCSMDKGHKPEEDFIDSYAVLYTLKKDLERE